RAEGAHVHPERRRARPAVEAEGDGAGGGVLHAVERVGDVEDRGLDGPLVVPQQQGAGGGRVGVGPAVQGQRVLGDRRLLFGRRRGLLLLRLRVLAGGRGGRRLGQGGEGEQEEQKR